MYTEEEKNNANSTTAQQAAKEFNISNGTINNCFTDSQPKIEAYNKGSSNIGSSDFGNLFEFKLFDNDTVNTANASGSRMDYGRWANLAYGAVEVYKSNGIAATLVDRLVASVINTGLKMQAITENITDSKAIEQDFKVWSDNAYLCDYSRQRSWSELQAQIYQLALVYGDVLVVAHASTQNNLPLLQVISTDKLTNPDQSRLNGDNYVQEGVEIDRYGKQVAFWVTNAKGEAKRINAYGRVSGIKRTAWLVYGHRTRRVNGVRGYPVLNAVYEFIKDIDKLSKANLKKGIISSSIAAFVKKSMIESNSMPDYNPLSEAAGKIENKTIAQTGTDINYKQHDVMDGTVVTGLNAGEEIVQIKQEGMGTDYISYQDAQIKICAYALEVPPNVFKMEYDQSFNATQATNNQFNSVIQGKRAALINQHYSHVYSSFILALAVNNKITNSITIIDAFNARDGLAFYKSCVAVWVGSVIQTSDLKKTTAAIVHQLDNNLISLDQGTGLLNNGSLDENLVKIKEEKEKLKELGLLPAEEEQLQKPGA